MSFDKKFSYWRWCNLIPKKEILKLNRLIEENYTYIENNKKHAHDSQGNSKKNTLVKVVEYKKIKTILKDFIDLFVYAGRFNFGYDIFEVPDLELLNLNIYSSKDKAKYDWHTDGSDNPKIDTKLTILINVSLKTYEGGNFYLFNNNEFEVPELNEPGNAIMFKSAINHKVLPVTKGERRTLAIFLYGPAFR